MTLLNEIEKLDDKLYYFECCGGLGDTMLTCGYINALEKKYHSKIKLIVKKSHAFVPEMYGINDSLVIGKDISEDFMKKNTLSKPQKGKVYSAHPCKHPELWSFFEPVYYYTSTIRFMEWFKQFLGIDNDTPLAYPKSYPKLPQKLKDSIQRIAPLDKIAMISPEAVSVPALPIYFWEELVEKLNKKGLQVVSNVMNPANTVSGTHYINMSSKEAVALSMECDSVYSVRSGLCDLIFQKGSNLHVYHPLHKTFFLYEMNEMFPGMNIDERIILPE